MASRYSPKLPVRTKALQGAILKHVPGIGDRDVVGAEIGVYLGANAAGILHAIPRSFLYLIDAYDPQVYRQKNDKLSETSHADHQQHYATAQQAIDAATDGDSGRYQCRSHNHSFLLP